jgi:hypothetical protein
MQNILFSTLTASYFGHTDFSTACSIRLGNERVKTNKRIATEQRLLNCML